MRLYSAGAQALARQNLTVVGQSYELGRVTVDCDELTVAEIQSVLSEGDDDRAQQVRAYEQSAAAWVDEPASGNAAVREHGHGHRARVVQRPLRSKPGPP